MPSLGHNELTVCRCSGTYLQPLINKHVDFLINRIFSCVVPISLFFWDLLNRCCHWKNITTDISLDLAITFNVQPVCMSMLPLNWYLEIIYRYAIDLEFYLSWIFFSTLVFNDSHGNNSVSHILSGTITMLLHSLWPGDATWHYGTWSTLIQAITWTNVDLLAIETWSFNQNACMIVS